MKNIITFLVATIIASIIVVSCGQNSNKQKELALKENELQLKEKELQLKEDSIKGINNSVKSNQNKTESENKNSSPSNMEEMLNILNTWLKDAIGYNSRININSFKKSSLNSVQNYNQLISNSFQEKINFRVNDIKPEIEVADKSIILKFENEMYSYEKFIILEDKFIYSYHAGAGDDRRCVVYDLLTQQEKEYTFNIQSVQNNIATISQDGYDNEGHFWQKGQLNLSTGSKTWGSKTH